MWGRPFDEVARDTDEGDSAVWSPKMDVVETDTAYEVTVDLPGVPKDRIDVSYRSGHLAVRGERSEEKTEEKKNYLRVESSYGSFYRSMVLPAGVEDGEIEARFEDGVLKIEIPKAEESRRQKIPIA
jgi:HSP20 family protein